MLCLLEVGVAMMMSVRKPAVAGSFYPAAAKEIRAMAADWIHPAADGPAPQAVIGWDGWKDAELYTYQTEIVEESAL